MKKSGKREVSRRVEKKKKENLNRDIMHVRIILMLYNNIYLLLSEAINQSNCVQIFVLIKNYIVAGKFFKKKKKSTN